MKGILPSEIYQHFALYVVSMRKLLTDSISNKDLIEAEKFLDLFCKKYSTIYGANDNQYPYTPSFG